MATNTAASFTNHTGNGTAGPFNISFSYLSEAEVDVTVGGVLKTITTHYTFTSATQITFTSGNEPANGVAIKFQRDTNISAKKVDFADGSVLTEADLDANSDQVLFAQQEIIDKLGTIEENATGDQTAAEIRTLVESASDSNVFTDADHSKLNAIEASATADQTAAEIRTLVESASDSNVFTDADHTKLNGIEASATADQTAAEIRTLVESASDSNVFTDADHSKLNGIEAGATADQTITEIKSLIAGSPLDASHLAANSVDSSELVDGSIDTSHLSADCVDSTKIADNAIGSEHLQANSVGTSEIADAELTTLAGMQSATASKLADSTALTSDIADLNQLDGMAKQTTITDDDTKFPTSGAVVDFVAAQIAPIGGLEVIANEDSFPTTQPASGVVISISDIEGLIVNGSGVATNARTSGNGSDNVTINGFPSSLQSKTMAAGLGLMVSSTGSSQTYTYHKLLAKEADVEQLSNDINDFAARYRVGSSNPTSELDAGDLFFNTSTQKLLVYNGTNSAWEEAQSIGNFFISTLSPAFNGSTQDFTITNAPANAQQILLSINGVVQKPNSGTSTPSEGFALSGSTVKLAAAPPSGSDYFAIVLGSTVNIGTPSNNTVSTDVLQNGSVTTAKIATDAVTHTKLANMQGNVNFNDTARAVFGSANDLQIVHTGTASQIIQIYSQPLQIDADALRLRSYTGNESYITANVNGAVKLYYDNSQKLETTSTGITASGTQHIFSSGTSGDCTVIIEADTDNNAEDDNPKLVFKQDGGLAEAAIGMNLTNSTSNPSNEFFIASGINEGAIVLATTSTNGYTNATERLRVTNTGNIQIPVDSGSSNVGRLQLGAGQDLQIYHDGTDSKIYNSSATPLKIQNVGSNGATVHIQARADEEGIKLLNNSGESKVELYYDGNKKFETTSVGVNITGNLGLGVTSPTNKIDISGTGNQQIQLVRTDGVGSGGNGFIFKAGSNASSIFTTGGEHTIKLFTNSAEKVVVNSAGHVTKPYHVCFGATGNQGTYAVAAGQTIAFNQKHQSYPNSRHSAYSTSNYRFTAPVTGIYSFTVNLYFRDVNLTNLFSLVPKINGSEVTGGGGDIMFIFSCQNINHDTTISGTVLLELDANDYVEIARRTGQTGSHSLYMPHSSFFGHLIG